MTMPWRGSTPDLDKYEEWVKLMYPKAWKEIVRETRYQKLDYPLYKEWVRLGKPTAASWPGQQYRTDKPWPTIGMPTEKQVVSPVSTGWTPQMRQTTPPTYQAPAEAAALFARQGPEAPAEAPAETAEKKEGWIRENDFLGPGRDAMVLYGNGIVADFRDISQDVGQSLPVQARWYLQELERTRRVLGLEQKPSGIEESVKKRLGTQGEIEQITGQSESALALWSKPGTGQGTPGGQGAIPREDISRAWLGTQGKKAPDGEGEITEEDIEVMKRLGEGLVRGKLTELEAIRQRDIEFKRLGAQFESDKAQLLRGLPAGPEGAVARWFVTQMRKPWQIMTGPEREVDPSALAGPPTPSWLPEFVPGTKAGQPLGKGMATTSGGQGSGLPFVPTPSGQQLTRMAPSQAQWLSGAINWYGGRPWGDILAQAEQMQPLTPQGAGRRRWSPPSQNRV